jgi:hypothetical protein
MELRCNEDRWRGGAFRKSAPGRSAHYSTHTHADAHTHLQGYSSTLRRIEIGRSWSSYDSVLY